MGRMKKNRYNFPQHATNSNNNIYNRYVENMFYTDEYDGPFTPDDSEKTPKWKKNGRYDIYHSPYDNTDMHQDRRTVAQHYIDRTARPNG